MLVMKKKPSPPDLTDLTRGELEVIIVTLWDRLAALETKVDKNSSNSSKPPSSDGLVKKTRSLREASGKQAGGQLSHKGTTLKRVEQPTETVFHRLPMQCDQCHHLLPLNQAHVSERRQVFDVPERAFAGVEHCSVELVCQCGQVHVSAFPEGVTEVAQYGPNVRALGVHLTQRKMLPFARAAELIHDIYGLSVSPGTLLAWVGEARCALPANAISSMSQPTKR